MKHVVGGLLTVALLVLVLTGAVLAAGPLTPKAHGVPLAQIWLEPGEMGPAPQGNGSADLEIHVASWGQPAAFNTMAYRVKIHNASDEVAGGAALTVTLPSGLTYLAHTGPYTVTGTSPALTLDLGAIQPWSWNEFYLFFTVGDLPPDTELETIFAVGSTLFDPNPDNNAINRWDYVRENTTYLNVTGFASMNSVAPGAVSRYQIDVCNAGATCSNPVQVHYYLPPQVTFVGWKSLTPGWLEESHNGSELVLSYPGIGNEPELLGSCASFEVTGQLNAPVAPGTRVTTHVAMSSTSDLTPEDNDLYLVQDVATRFADLALTKTMAQGVLVPGGEVTYKLSYRNLGNTGALNVAITDTLPTGTVFLEAFNGDTGEPWPPASVSGQRRTWIVPTLPVNTSGELWIRAQISPAVLAGTVLLNQAEIASLPGEWLTANNIASWSETVHPSGVNLRLSQSVQWWSTTMATIRLDFANLGATEATGIILTDTYPEGFRFLYAFHNGAGFDGCTDNPATRVVTCYWDSSLSGGVQDGLELNFEVDGGGLGQTFTNNASISSFESDTDPTDNLSSLNFYGGSELSWIDLDVHHPGGMIQGQVIPEASSYPVVLTEPLGGSYQTYPDDGGYWYFWMPHSLEPGDVITVTAGQGRGPVVITIPAPFTAEGDRSTPQVSGTIAESVYEPVRVWLDTSPVEFLTATRTDASYQVPVVAFPKGTGGHVDYSRRYNDVPVLFHRYFWNEEIALHVNLTWDEVAFDYPPGRQAQIALLSATRTPLASAMVYSFMWGGVYGSSGFRTAPYSWGGYKAPDIQPGQYVTAQVTGGGSAEVRLGAINAVLNVDQDQVTGTVDAPWLLPNSVMVECKAFNHATEAWVSKWTSVLPNNTATFVCNWSGELDLTPFDTPTVTYFTPEAHAISVVLAMPTPYVTIFKGLKSPVGQTSNASYEISYVNLGDAPAEQVRITDIMTGVVYLGDTAPVAHSGSGPVVWNIGTLQPGESGSFTVFAQIVAGLGQPFTNTVTITTTSPYNRSSWWEMESTSIDWVNSQLAPLLTVKKEVTPYAPAPGQSLTYRLEVCNDGDASSNSVTLTDNLPAELELVKWWSDHGGWSRIGAGNPLAFTRPSVDAYTCSWVYVKARVRNATAIGTVVTNTVTLASSSPITRTSAQVVQEIGEPDPDLGLQVDPLGAVLVPGGWVLLGLDYSNWGNVDAQSSIRITTTLPLGTTFLEAWDAQTDLPVTPVQTLGRILVWEFPALSAGTGGGFKLKFALQDTLTPGTALDFKTQIAPLPGEGYLINNASTWHDQVFAPGLNLRITKSHQWDYGAGTLNYTLVFENVGDSASPYQSPLFITDTLPLDLQVLMDSVSLGYPTMEVWQDGQQLIAGIYKSLDPGERGWLSFAAMPLEPGPYHWYTNTVTIQPVAGESTWDDNQAVDYAFSGTPISYANLYWGWLHQFVEAGLYTSGDLIIHAGQPVTLTTPTQTLVTWSVDGYVTFDFEEPLAPGDCLSLLAGSGAVPVWICIPAPFTLQAEAGTGLVSGRVGTSMAELRLEVPKMGYWHALSASDGTFAASFPGMKRGTNGRLILYQVSNGTEVHIKREFMTRDFMLEVNYAHDEVQGRYYKPGSTATVKVIQAGGTYTVTGPIELPPGCEEPFFSSEDRVWQPTRPNIRPGNTVRVETSDGVTTQMIVGTIHATVDVAANSIQGTVSIPQVLQGVEQAPVQVECLPWGAPTGDVEPVVVTVIPDGQSLFTCSWNGIWDIQAGQPIAVRYTAYDGNKVLNVFNEPQPDLTVAKEAAPLPAVVNSTLFFTVTVQNIGQAPAYGVRVTDTLPVSMTLSSVTPSVGTCTASGRIVICEVGALEPEGAVEISLQVIPQATGVFVNQVRVGAEPPDANPADNADSLTFSVVAANTVTIHDITPRFGVNTQATAVTIYGANFASGATADLYAGAGVYPLSGVTFINAQTLQATVLANLPPGTYHLRVILPGGAMGVLLNAFTVLSPAAPTISAMLPAEGINTLPVLVDIYGSNFVAGLSAALRKSGRTDTPLQAIGFVDSTHINATVPAGLPGGTYTLVITNPGGLTAQLSGAYQVLPVIDDLRPRQDSFLMAPPSPRAGDEVTMTITVRRVGGTTILSNVAVDFYAQSPSGAETYLGRGVIPTLAPDSRSIVPPVSWIPSSAGLYTLRAVIDPANAIAETFEDNNVITRTLEVLPARAADITPPLVVSFTLNLGAEWTTERQIVLNTLAQDEAGGSGVARVLYVEYVFNLNFRQWVAVAVSDWLPYPEAGTNYPWLLYPMPGVHYFQVWVADAAGNISQNFGMAYINLMPGTTPVSLAEDNVHIYLMHLIAGQGATLRLTSVSGDADIYVWRPGAAGPVLVAASYLEDPVEEVSFNAPVTGPYLVEVYGYATSTYLLDIALNGGTRYGMRGGVILPSRGRDLPTMDPGLTPDSDTEEVSVPSAPVLQSKQYLFLPIVLRKG